MSYTCKPLEGVYAELTDKTLGIKHTMYEFNGNFVYPFLYKNIAQKVLDAPVRKDDTWLISYPRTGSTWCQEMIWLIGNNLDFDTARNTLQQFRAPLLESSVALYQYAEVFEEKFSDSVDYVNNLRSPRFIKSHLPYSLLPTEIHKIKPKIIYTMRHPKDVCVSYYHHCKLVHGFNVDFETFCELFLNNALAGGGIFSHYKDFWNRRHEENILFLRYEEMRNDTRGSLKKIANFMEKPLSEKDLTALEEFLSFQEMRNNRGCNFAPLVEHIKGRDFYNKAGVHFMRKGEVGDWKNHMSREMSNRFDEWIEKNNVGTGLCFNN